MPKRESQATQPEIAIGPHPAREGWRVLRVSYPGDYEHLLKIGAAIDALLGRPRRPSAPSDQPARHGRGPVMSAPTSTHDLTALAGRLQQLGDEVARLGAELVTIAHADAGRFADDRGQSVGAVLTLTQAAQALGRSRSWVHEQVRRGVIPAMRLGSRWWIRRTDLIEGRWL